MRYQVEIATIGWIVVFHDRTAGLVTPPDFSRGGPEMSYALRLSDDELTRYRIMAERARAQEADLWELAGLTAGAVLAAADVTNAEVRPGRAEDTGLPAGSFDTVVLRHVLAQRRRRTAHRRPPRPAGPPQAATSYWWTWT